MCDTTARSWLATLSCPEFDVRAAVQIVFPVGSCRSSRPRVFCPTAPNTCWLMCRATLGDKAFCKPAENRGARRCLNLAAPICCSYRCSILGSPRGRGGRRPPPRPPPRPPRTTTAAAAAGSTAQASATGSAPCPSGTGIPTSALGFSNKKADITYEIRWMDLGGSISRRA